MFLISSLFDYIFDQYEHFIILFIQHIPIVFAETDFTAVGYRNRFYWSIAFVVRVNPSIYRDFCIPVRIIFYPYNFYPFTVVSISHTFRIAGSLPTPRSDKVAMVCTIPMRIGSTGKSYRPAANRCVLRQALQTYPKNRTRRYFIPGLLPSRSQFITLSITISKHIHTNILIAFA